MTAAPAHLDAFVRGVSGEWVGSEATCDPTTGHALPLPNYYIPEDFAEWNIHPRGFQSNHAVTLRRGDTLWRKHFRVLPTVSAFGDHLDIEEDVFEHGVADAGFSYFVGEERGVERLPVVSYVAAPGQLEERTSVLEALPRFEMMLASGDVGEEKARERSMVRFKVDYGSGQVDGDLQIISEEYDMPFCNGSCVDGGSGYDTAGIGERTVLDCDTALATSAEWGIEGPASGVESEKGWRSGKVARSSGGTVLGLPGGMYLIVGSGDDGDFVVEFGRVGEARRESLVRRYARESGQLLGTAMLIARPN